jgi:hypothetical protein
LLATTSSKANVSFILYASSWYIDDSWTVYAKYEGTRRTCTTKVCTIKSVASTNKFKVEVKRGLHALPVTNTGTGKIFALDLPGLTLLRARRGSAKPVPPMSCLHCGVRRLSPSLRVSFCASGQLV